MIPVRSLGLVVAGLLAGCGFQLRGPVDLPPAMEVTYIQPPDRFSLVVRGLQDAIEEAGARVTEQPDQATARLILLRDDSGQRVLSVTARNIPVEYEVFYIVRWELVGADGRLLEPQTVARVRDYTYDTTQVIGKARESENIRRALAEEVVDTIMRRLASVR